MDPSSSDMGEDVVAAVTIGGAAALLLGAGGYLALKQFGTSSEKKVESPNSPAPMDENAQAPQLQSEPTGESQHSQTKPAPIKQTLSSSGPKTQALPGHIDETGIDREAQPGLRCGMHSLNAIFKALGKDVVTPEEFDKDNIDGAHAEALVNFARKRRLFPAAYQHTRPEPDNEFYAILIKNRINDSKGFIVSQPCGALAEVSANQSTSEVHENTKNTITHWVPFTRGLDGDWYVSNPDSPQPSFKHPGMGIDAFRKYVKEGHGGYKNASIPFTPEVIIIHDKPPPTKK
jgi:hypothetical protein